MILLPPALAALPTRFAGLVGATAPGTVALAFGVGFPLYVAGNPEAFGPERLASPLPETLSPMAREPHRFAALAPVLARAPSMATEKPWLDERATGAIGDDRVMHVRAISGSRVLIAHEGGLHVFGIGDRLPSGARLLGVGEGGALLTDRDASRIGASPEQGG